MRAFFILCVFCLIPLQAYAGKAYDRLEKQGNGN